MSERKTVIREMRERDIDSVYAIECLAFQDAWSRESFARELNENKNVARYFVVELDGTVIGYGGMWLVMEEAHVTNIAIHPQHQKNGLGGVLIDTMLVSARKLGIVFMTLECRKSNFVAQKLYERRGFSRVGVRKRYYENNNEDAILYVHENVNAYKPIP